MQAPRLALRPVHESLNLAVYGRRDLPDLCQGKFALQHEPRKAQG